MSLKIIKRKSLVWNLIVFLTMSIFYLYIQKCLIKNLAAINLSLFIEFLKNNVWYLLLYLLTIKSIYNIGRGSFLLLLLFLSCSFYMSIGSMGANFNKINLLLSFFYLIIVYNVTLFWKEELLLPIYNSNYDSTDLRVRQNYIIKVKVCSLKGSNVEKMGILTNWNESSCFIRFSDPCDDWKGNVKLVFDFLSQQYVEMGEIYTRLPDNCGLGIIIPSSSNLKKDGQWLKVYSMLRDFGFIPDYVV